MSFNNEKLEALCNADDRAQVAVALHEIMMCLRKIMISGFKSGNVVWKGRALIGLRLFVKQAHGFCYTQMLVPGGMG